MDEQTRKISETDDAVSLLRDCRRVIADLRFKVWGSFEIYTIADAMMDRIDGYLNRGKDKES